MTVTASVTTDIAVCQALRRTVFIEEQGVSETEELDGRDGEAVHVVALDGDDAIGCARMLVADGTGKIGRVCVLKEHRGKGVGEVIMQAMHAEARRLELSRVALGAQLTALSFYERLGYTAYGTVFDDAGIDHKMMERAP